MFDKIAEFFSNKGFMPHIHCYLAKPSLVWTMFVTDMLIGIAYVAISITLWAIIKRIRLPFTLVVLCFGVFIAACGGTHLMEVYTLWVPNYWFSAGLKVVTAIASVGTGIYLFRLRHPIITVAEAAKLSEQRRLDLESLTQDLESRVEERTRAFESSRAESRKAADQLRLITNTVPSLIAYVDRELVMRFANDAFLHWYGKPPSEIVGMTMQEALGESFHKVQSSIERALSGESVVSELEINYPRVGNRIVQASYTPDRNHEIRGVVILVSDITDRVRTERNARFLSEVSKALAQSLDYRETLKSLARLAVPDLGEWCVVDLPDGEKNMQRLQVTTSIDAKRHLIDKIFLFPPRLDRPDHPPVEAFLTGKTVLIPRFDRFSVESMELTSDHYEMVQQLSPKSLISAPLIARGKVLGVLTVFVTESDHVYDDRDVFLIEEIASRLALAIDNSRLYQVSQEAIRARDEFLSIASHELKTPLTSLALQAKIASKTIYQDEGASPASEKMRKLVDQTDRQVRRLTYLVDDMLDISRIASGKFDLNPETFDLSEMLKDVVERMKPLLSAAGCQLSVDLEPDLIGTWDRFRIEQVVSNLLTNAAKYGVGKPVEIRSRRRGKLCEFSITDHGRGIAKEDHERIFLRFERATSASEISGLGLGLYIVRQILDRHFGSIEVKSSLNQGATFTVTLPAGAVQTESLPVREDPG